MKEFQTTKNLVQKINFAFFPATVLGFFYFSYNVDKVQFTKNWVLYIYSRCVLAVILIITILMVIFLLLMSIRNVDLAKLFQKGDIQAFLLWGLNSIALWFSIVITYYNHAINQSVLLQILNDIVKCNSILMKLFKKDIPTVKRYNIVLILRSLTTILDVGCSLYRPNYFTLITRELKPMLVMCKFCQAALFFEWYFIQTRLANTYEALNHFAKLRDGNLRAKDYRALSKICTRIYKIKRNCSIYYGRFAVTTCMGLIRTVALTHESFSAIFFTNLFEGHRLLVFGYVMKILIICISAPVIDLIILCIMAENLVREGEHFRWNLVISECKFTKEIEIQKTIDMILRQAHWENLKWVSVAGQQINRKYGMNVVVEAISWAMIFLMYDPEYVLAAALTFDGSKVYSLGVYIAVWTAICYCALVYKELLRTFSRK